MIFNRIIRLGFIATVAASCLAGLTVGAFAQGAGNAAGKTTTPPAGAAGAAATGKTTTPTLGATPLALPPNTGAGAGPTAAAAAAATAPKDSPWQKVCGPDPATQKTACVVIYEIRTEQGQLVSQVTIQKIEALGSKDYGVRVVLPIGVFLPPGITLTVDGKGKGAQAAYTICLPQPAVCLAEGIIDAATFDTMRKGTKIAMVAKNGQQKDMSFDLSLAGFAKVYDSQGVDQATAAANEDALNKALAARAEQARQQLIQKQQNPGAP